MSTTFSDHWYRVAALHPRLRHHVRIDRHTYRGEVWHLLKDPVGGRQHRLNQAGYRVVARFDGRLSLQQIWALLVAEGGDDAPTQPEVIALLGQLHDAELIQTESSPDVAQLFATAERRRTRLRRQRLNPLSMRVPLLDPTPLLDALVPMLRPLLRPAAAWAWALLVVAALIALAPRAGELAAYGAHHLATPRMLLILFLVYPLIKSLHELAHGIAVRAWGGEVRETGITLMLLMPVPYVDASSASGFRSRTRRVVVSLMGILTETTLAALAAFVWLLVADGTVRDIAFATLTIGGVSTLLFNGNPLMRFDAYHALSDAIESPGLATRGEAWWRCLWRRHVLGVEAVQPPVATPGERRWLLGHAAASFVYRLAISVAMVGWVLGLHLLLGALLAAWMLVVMVLMPAWRLLRYARHDPELDGRRARALALCGAVVLLPLLVVLGLPVPQATSAAGVVWVPERALVRAQVDGFVAQVAVADGQQVAEGDLVLQLHDPVLLSERERIEARLEGLDVAYTQALFHEPAQANLVAEEIRRQQAERDRLQSRIESLSVRSGSAGRIALRQPGDLPGRFMARGTVLAHVIGAEPPTVRAIVPEADVDRLRQRPGPIEVRLADAPGQALAATLAAQTPAAVRQLPSAVLGDRFGGPLPTDPADPDGLRSLAPLFAVDVALPGQRGERIGTRATVRFDHGRSTLARQWLMRLRQLFVGRWPGTLLGARSADEAA